jgi:Mitochondrial carrier protein
MHACMHACVHSNDRLQVQAFIEPSHPKHEHYNSVPKATATILRDDGFGAFFSGLGPRMFRICCARPRPALTMTDFVLMLFCMLGPGTFVAAPECSLVAPLGLNGVRFC